MQRSAGAVALRMDGGADAILFSLRVSRRDDQRQYRRKAVTKPTVLVSVTLMMALWTASALAAECPFKAWQTFKGTQLYRIGEAGAYFYGTDYAAIDADGAPNAYHPDDVGKPCLSTHTGLDCPDNAGYPHGGWKGVLVEDPSNPSTAYVQKDGAFKGFSRCTDNAQRPDQAGN